MEDWKIAPLILFLCGVGMLILGFISNDSGFDVYVLAFFGASCFSLLLADTGGAA